MPNEPVVKIDGLIPSEIALKAENVGVAKGNLPLLKKFLLSILAGAFISLGAIFCTTVITGNGANGAIALPFGIMKLLGGVVFCLGLILVVVAGAELFTGNNLLIMATVSKKLTIAKLVRSWVIVYIGNFVGSVLTAYGMYLTMQYTMANGGIGLKALAIANGKCGLDFMPALTRGIFCNALVCLAVWLCFSCRSTTDKILAIIFPITGFVACGFEHCVANMYFVPIGLLVKSDTAFLEKVGKTAGDYENLTLGNFFSANLVPVTIGNIIGGVLFVGIIYWMIYCKKAKEA